MRKASTRWKIFHHVESNKKNGKERDEKSNIKWTGNEFEIEIWWDTKWKLNRRVDFCYCANISFEILTPFCHPQRIGWVSQKMIFISFFYLICNPFRLPQMSHLYSMFAKQVQTYCKSMSSNASQCKKKMMLYGITKLNDMEETHLDRMDPYQRNANTIRKCRLLFRSKAINPCQIQIGMANEPCQANDRPLDDSKLTIWIFTSITRELWSDVLVEEISQVNNPLVIDLFKMNNSNRSDNHRRCLPSSHSI